MADDAKPILGYASVAPSLDPPADDFSMTFANPPVGSQIAATFLGMIIFACGAGGFLLVAIRTWVRDSRSRDDSITVSFLFTGFFVLIVVALIFELCRILRHRDSCVEIELRNRVLRVSAPLQLRRGDMHFSVARVERVEVIREGLVVAGQRVVQLRILTRGGILVFPHAVRIAMHEKGVIDRAVADLNRAINLAKQK